MARHKNQTDESIIEDEAMANVHKILGISAIIVAALTILYLAIGGANQMNSGITTTINISNGTQLSSYVPCTNGSVCYVNQRISNFVVLNIDAVNQTVTGLEWIMYPVANEMPRVVTLRVGDSVGYKCQGTFATLTTINVTYALFAVNNTVSGGCPI